MRRPPPARLTTEALAVFALMVGSAAAGVVHGDPGPSNLRITDDGRVGLLDCDGSRIDVVHLGLPVLDDDEDERALRCEEGWLARLRGASPAP